MTILNEHIKIINELIDTKKDMVLGDKIADLFVTFGSLDVNMGEVDR